MKPTFKDYLNIVLALIAIFLCGYGIGFLLGERKGQGNQPPPPAPSIGGGSRKLGLLFRGEMLLQTLVEGLEFPATGFPGGSDSLGGLGDLAPDGLPLFRGQFANGPLNGLECGAFPGFPIDDGGWLGGGSGWGG